MRHTCASGRRLLVVLGLAAQCGAIWAAVEPPRPLQPFIQSVFPKGGRRGAEFQAVIRGKYLSGASRVRVSGAGVDARITECSDSQITLQVKVDASAPVGRRDLRVFTSQGTFVQAFEVGALPERMEAEPNDDPKKAALVELPVVVNGKVLPGDYDCFRFHARAGQAIVFDLNSSRNGTRFDSMLWLLDASGREVGFADDSYFDKDPFLAHTFTESGEYVLRVSGFREAGSDASEYRLMIGELPKVSHVFPAGSRRGDTVELTLDGVNLDTVEDVTLDGLSTRSELIARSGRQVRVRLAIPETVPEGLYDLRVRTAQAILPNTLPYAVSGMREVVVSGGMPDPLDLSTPVILNGAIRTPKQADDFWIEVAAGERIAIEADGMSLGNFLDPAVTIFDTGGNVVAYIDESAPNGFDKEPPNLDFHLEHTFQKPGRYRIQMRDAALRGRDDFVYRLRVSRSTPKFEVFALTNQVSVLTGQTALLPVRIKRLDGWDVPVKVWVEGLPSRVESQSVTAEPVNTRFRGTFGEDFFFDGTNVDLPLQAHRGAPPGAYRLQVRARGTMHGRTLERTAVVFYPWQQTGYLRGKAHDPELLLTVADPPLFELEAPATFEVSAEKPSELKLRVRWFEESLSNGAALRIEPERLPPGIVLDRFEAKPGSDVVSAWLRADERFDGRSERFSLAGVVQVEGRLHRRPTPDIELKRAPGQPERGLAGK